MLRHLSLTAELVRAVERVVPDAGDQRGLTPLSDEEYRRFAEIVACRSGRTIRVFAYGSLIWKPPAGFRPLATVRAHGWRRSFCLDLPWFRGTPDQPGVMLALDRGGCCDGVLLDSDDGAGADIVEGLLRREIDYAQDISFLRWIPVRSGAEKTMALAFYAAPRGDGVFVHLPLEEQARRIARAAGSAGSCAAYLHNTIVKLLEHGIQDSYLWRLQSMVAAEIRGLRDVAETAPTM